MLPPSPRLWRNCRRAQSGHADVIATGPERLATGRPSVSGPLARNCAVTSMVHFLLEVIETMDTGQFRVNTRGRHQAQGQRQQQPGHRQGTACVDGRKDRSQLLRDERGTGRYGVLFPVRRAGSGMPCANRPSNRFWNHQRGDAFPAVPDAGNRESRRRVESGVLLLQYQTTLQSGASTCGTRLCPGGRKSSLKARWQNYFYPKFSGFPLQAENRW